MAKQSMYDWKAGVIKKGPKKLNKDFYLNRLEDDKRLANSRLPCFQRFETRVYDFKKSNKELIEFVSQYKEFMVRVLPIKSAKGFPRTFKRGGVHTFEHCREFLDFTFNKNSDYIDNEEFYKISLSETEVNLAGGVIISTPKNIFMEIKEESNIKTDTGLSGLCYQGLPDQSGVMNFTRFIKPGMPREKIIWRYDKLELSKIILRALKYLRISGKDDHENPDNDYMRGYFEFLQTKSDEIIFWDYKIQEFFQR